VVIDATQPKAAVADLVWRSVSERFDLASAAVLPAGATS
jgi:hypothetical protein